MRSVTYSMGVSLEPYRRDGAVVPGTGRPPLVARRTRRRGGEAAMDVRVDEITGVRFVREPYPFVPHFPGHEVLVVQFLGPSGDTVLHCYVDELYDGQRMRPEKLAAWQALRERYGNRDESKVDRGSLLASPA
jgi:hypothetical protein